MNNEDYRKLINDFCRELQLPAPEQLFDAGFFKIGDFDVSLVFDEHLSPHLIFVYFDLGEIPGHRLHDAHREMLEANLVAGSQDNGVLGVHPTSGHAVFSARIIFTPTYTHQKLAHMLDRYCDVAEHWRNTVVAPKPGTEAPSSLFSQKLSLQRQHLSF